MSLLSRGQALLNRVMAAVSPVVGGVTYARPGGATLSAVPAWVGRTVYRQDGAHSSGAQVIFGERDYLITVAALAGVFPPKEGDRLTETVDGTPTAFELRPPASGEPAWRYSDQTRTVVRLHVKRGS